MPTRLALPMHGLALLMIAVPTLVAAPAAAEEMYSFVDEHGIVHLSNVPNDPRYHLTAEMAPSAPLNESEPEQPFAPFPTEDEEIGTGTTQFEPQMIVPRPQHQR